MLNRSSVGVSVLAMILTCTQVKGTAYTCIEDKSAVLTQEQLKTMRLTKENDERIDRLYQETRKEFIDALEKDSIRRKKE